MRLVGILVLLTASVCVAQAASDFKPAASNVSDAQLPKRGQQLLPDDGDATA